ncbi:exodeoxyribonuclease III [Fodinicurvata halophila]|uniref:Exodeoxyribonuclease III n=1 Tax=Fodinicurvata halophila TaxID=1419723 RepID=A0ABV8UM40_9PROT
MSLKIATWNVNSLRQRLTHLERLAEDQAPDVICLQETKVDDPLFPGDALAEMGYSHQVFRGQKAYNGVAILSRIPFKRRDHRIWCQKDDKRHVEVTLPGGLELHNFYVPSGGSIPDPEKNDKFAHKLSFLEEMAQWARSQTRGRKVLIVGDLNVAPLENDVWNHKRLVRSIGHTPGESQRIADLLEAGALVDAPRQFTPPDQPLYSWWGYRFPQAFERDYGWRLDHAFASQSLMPEIRRIETLRDARSWQKPSDHVPVIVELAA